ncbi:MAG: ATP-binding protein [Candidatus Nitrosocaldaceae archaeon]
MMYEIVSNSNYFAMPEDKQRLLLTRFLGFINNATVNHELKIIMMRDTISCYKVNRVFVDSREELAPFLEGADFKYTSAKPIALYTVREHVTYLEGVNNYMRVFTLVSLPSSLPVAYAPSLLDMAEMVNVRLKRMEHDVALSTILRTSSLLRAGGSIKMQQEVSKAEQLREALLRQETALFKFSLDAIIIANNKDELMQISKMFKRYNRAMLVKFEALPFMQSASHKHLYIELGSLAILYPFISSNMLEHNGINLGMNVVTKSPIIYDYRMRDNYNISILATSGAGKSVTAKTIVNRLLREDTHLYIIDPQGEYERLAKMYDASIIRLTDSIELGLDPFLLFDKSNACNIIADILNAPETVRKEIIALGLDVRVKINSIDMLYALCSENAKQYLVDIVKDVRLRGNAIIKDRTIFSMRSTYGSRARDSFLLTLALAKVWNTINSINIETPKILLIDEGWLLFNIETSAKFINLIARVGRKLNTIFIFITQRPEDLIVNEYGRAMLDNSDTKILLRNDYTASLKIAEALTLSKEEKEMLPLFSKGEGLLLTKDYRLRVLMLPTKEELEAFSTTPNI